MVLRLATVIVNVTCWPTLTLADDCVFVTSRSAAVFVTGLTVVVIVT